MKGSHNIYGIRVKTAIGIMLVLDIVYCLLDPRIRVADKRGKRREEAKSSNLPATITDTATDF